MLVLPDYSELFIVTDLIEIQNSNMTISIISHDKENGHFTFFCQTKAYTITPQPKLNAMAQGKNNMFVLSVLINAFLVWEEEREMLIN